MEIVLFIIFALIVTLLGVWFVRHLYNRMINGPTGYTYGPDGSVNIISSDEDNQQLN